MKKHLLGAESRRHQDDPEMKAIVDLQLYQLYPDKFPNPNQQNELNEIKDKLDQLLAVINRTAIIKLKID